MKIIFLDIDGVLVNHESMKLPQFIFREHSWHEAWPECVKALNLIIESTGAEIVVSSTWRIFGGGVVRANLEHWGVKGKFRGMTPRLGQARGYEIMKWMAENIKPEQFVILDDDSDMVDLKSNLVQTWFQDGLTMEDAKRAIEILSGVQNGRTVRQNAVAL